MGTANTPTAPSQLGPAADPKYPPTTHPSNPYNFSDALLECGKREPLVTPTHVYFFAHEGSSPYSVLSQWFASPFTGPKNPYSSPPDDTPVTFPTAEHYMMYHKALVMSDLSTAAEILHDDNVHPSRAKALGRQVQNFDGKLWKGEAERVVEEGNMRKFGQREELRDVLLGSGDRTFVEASPEDKIWGVGFAAWDAEGREEEWGENKLGKALVKVRERLRKGEGAA